MKTVGAVNGLKEKPTIIYIAGYGRSGSTVLDILLGSSRAVVSCGELATIFDEVSRGYVCSCGESYYSCGIWGRYFLNIAPTDLALQGDITKRIDRRTSILRPLEKQLTDEQKETYKYIWHRLITYRTAGQTHLVDSSKTTANASFRPVALKEIAGFDVRVIHITKRSWGVLHSLAKGSNRLMQNKKDIRVPVLAQMGLKSTSTDADTSNSGVVHNLLRGVVGRILANRDARMLKKRLGRKNYYNIQYEKLLENPLQVIALLEKYLGLNLKDVRYLVENNDYLRIEHIVGGNRINRSNEVRFMRRN